MTADHRMRSDPIGRLLHVLCDVCAVIGGAVLIERLGVTSGMPTVMYAVAVIGGVGLAVIFSLSRWAEMSFYPFAVVLQVTPVVAFSSAVTLVRPTMPCLAAT